MKELRRSLKNDFKASTGPSHRQSCEIVGVPIPEDGRVKEKEDEKVEKYRGLASEVGRMYSVRTRLMIGIISLKGEE